MCVRVYVCTCVCVCVCVFMCIWERENRERERKLIVSRRCPHCCYANSLFCTITKFKRWESLCELILFFSFLFFSLVFEYVLLYCTVLYCDLISWERAERHMSKSRTQASERKKEYILSGCHVGCFNTVDVRAVTENSQKNFNF